MSVWINGNKNCECSHCKSNFGFGLPLALLDSIKKGKLVIFAGAGVSTESKYVYNYTLYEDIKNDLGLEKDSKYSFSKLMSIYCEKRGRRELLLKIRNRIDYVYSFPELYRQASRFHKELATIEPIKDIITTNWDDLFERECGAIPIVDSGDFVFWDTPGRKVFKIHGSINNYGSIIATEEDYRKCYRKLNTSLVGGNLKLMLATKTILFIGYSFSDEDFNKVYNALLKETNSLLPQSYIVTTDEASKERFEKMGIHPIITDATFFLKGIKEHLVDEGYLLPDDIYDDVYETLMKLEIEHKKLSETFGIYNNPEVIFCTNYQDGLIHAFERILNKKKTGEYSHPCNIISLLKGYDEIRREKLKHKVYHDVAYIDGYTSGLTFLLVDPVKRQSLPLYYLFGSKKDLICFEDYLKECSSAKLLHKNAYKYAERIAKKYKNDIVMHHTPFL